MTDTKPAGRTYTNSADLLRVIERMRMDHLPADTLVNATIELNSNDTGLHGADFEDLDLTGTIWKYVDASHASFARTKLGNSRWDGCVGTGASFQHAYMFKAVFEGGEWDEVDFTWASLRSSGFFDTEVQGVNLKGSLFVGTDLTFAYVNADLDRTDWRDAVLAGTAIKRPAGDMKNIRVVDGGEGRIIVVNSRNSDLSPELFIQAGDFWGRQNYYESTLKDPSERAAFALLMAYIKFSMEVAK